MQPQISSPTDEDKLRFLATRKGTNPSTKGGHTSQMHRYLSKTIAGNPGIQSEQTVFQQTYGFGFLEAIVL